MASSKVMANSNSGNPDLARRPDPPPDSGDIAAKATSLMTLDGFLRNVYGDTADVEAEIPLIDAAGAITAVGDDDCAEPSIRRKTVDDVWREIVAGKSERKECKVEVPEEMMTLEDFLAKAGAVEEEEAAEEEDVKYSASVHAPIGMEGIESGAYSSEPVGLYLPPAMVHLEGRGRRGKRRAGAMLEVVDKATQQRQKRMIKNRESAARSRERKQAYQEELEALAGKLEEENMQLLREKAEWTMERYKQLMEKVVPVIEKTRPPRPLRRVRSMQW